MRSRKLFRTRRHHNHPRRFRHRTFQTDHAHQPLPARHHLPLLELILPHGQPHAIDHLTIHLKHHHRHPMRLSQHRVLHFPAPTRGRLLLRRVTPPPSLARARARASRRRRRHRPATARSAPRRRRTITPPVHGVIQPFPRALGDVRRRARAPGDVESRIERIVPLLRRVRPSHVRRARNRRIHRARAPRASRVRASVPRRAQ